jgi:molybdopterin biosynthesis enzyme MoaB
VPAGGWDCDVPLPGGGVDPTSTNCAHTFILSAWDRTIDGFSRIHYAQSTQSITILP